MKVTVVIFHRVQNRMCTYMTLCGRPQTSNECSSLNDDDVCGALEYFREEENNSLANVAVDCLSCGDYFTPTLA